MDSSTENERKAALAAAIARANLSGGHPSAEMLADAEKLLLENLPAKKRSIEQLHATRKTNTRTTLSYLVAESG